MTFLFQLDYIFTFAVSKLYCFSLQPGVDPSTVQVMEIGSYNVFEVDCVFESTKMGDQNVLEVKCKYCK